MCMDKFWAVLVGSILIWAAGFAHAATGRTAGQFGVSGSGQATYAIPLWTPPGVAGVQPALALIYNSSDDNGLLGVGWQLAGLSSITRCARTYAQDGVGGSPQLDSNDRFCLDGQRLRLTSSLYGADGSTYQTEIANFANVIAHGVAGSGPAWFEVKAKDGLTYEYGNSADSAIPAFGSSSIRVWALNRVRDRNGNSMVMTYANDTTNGSYRPQGILYTYTQSTSAAYQVVFTYQSRASADGLWTYSVGGKSNEFNYLSQISAQYFNGSSWTAVRSYTLSYGNSPTTSRTRLNSIQECAGSDCLPASTVAYQDGQTGFGGEVVSSGNLSMSFALPIDLNGDGYDDLAYPDSASGNWYYLLGTASGIYAGPYSSGLPNTNYAAAIACDYNSDGKIDVLVPNTSGNWRVMSFQSQGTGFASLDTTTPTNGVTRGWVTCGDIDGDGRDDLIYLVSGGSGYTTSDYGYYRLNTGNGFSSTATTFLSLVNGGPSAGNWKKLGAQPLGTKQYSSRIRRPDLNGDGRMDIFVQVKNCFADRPAQCDSPSTTTVNWQTFMSRADGGWSSSGVVTSGNNPPIPGDFNGDGCNDVVYGLSSTSTWYVAYGTCWRSGATSPFTVPANTGVVYSANAVVMDWDGDGKDDLIQPNASNVWGYIRATGSGFAAWTSAGSTFTSTAGFYVADVNGDGASDLVYGGASFVPAVRIHNGVRPDLATSFTDGYGISVSPSYVYITRSNYTKLADASYPQQDYQGPMTVVGLVTASDGIGGTYTQSYNYWGAHINLQGRGFLGFHSRRSYDSRKGVSQDLYYRRDYPFTGQIIQDVVFYGSYAHTLRETLNTLALTTLNATAYNQRYFPYIGTSTVRDFEVGGPKDAQNITTTAATYSYDTYGNAVNVATVVTDNDSTSPHAGLQWTATTTVTLSPDAGSNWCLDQPSLVTMTKTAPGVPSITRTVQLIPDYSKCRPTQKILEPASGSYRVGETYGFDTFGNINSIAITGIGLPARNMAINWGTTGQFPIAITNALGQATTRGYNYALGLQTSESDPNGISTTWTFDGFGRVTRKNASDGTAVTWAYNNCAVAGCVNGNNRMTVVEEARNTNNAVRSDQFTYLDQFDRTLVTRTRLMTGAYQQTESQYDSSGRLSRQSFPCKVSDCAVSTSWATYSYDLLDRVLQENRPISATNPALQATTYNYQGRTTIVTDSLAKTRTLINTVAGTLARTKDHDGYYQNFGYDAYGSLLSITDSLSNTLFGATYDYGIRALVRTTSDMDLGTRSFTYNALGEVSSGSDGKGQSFGMTYDALSRPISRTEPEGTTTWTWGNSAALRNIGRLYTVTSPGYAELLTYDAYGRMSNRKITSDADYYYDYTYDTLTGLQDTLTYPTSTSGYRLKLQYLYQNGALQQVKDANASTVFWQANALNARGQVLQETLGNGVVTNRTYDAVTGWISSIQSGPGGGAVLQNESYLFDRMGNVTQRQNNNLGLTENFYYDNLYRLDYSTLNNVTNLDLAYDAMGNITSRSDIASGATWTYHATRKHAVVQAGSASYTYSYDANGNAQTRNGYGLTWTSYNYPSVINGPGKTLTFSYGPDRQRFKQIYNNGSTVETTMYIGGLLEKVTAAGVTDWRHYVSAGGATVAIVSRQSTGTNTTRYILEDHQGSIAQITDSAGVSYVAESFTAFGARRDASTWSGACQCTDLAKIKSVTRHGYTGQEAIGGVSMGLNHMNGRVQDAITGRFLSPDPLTSNPMHTQSYNRYSYVLNNPLTFNDPTGFKPSRPVLPYNGQASSVDRIIAWVETTARREGSGSFGGFGPGGQAAQGRGAGIASGPQRDRQTIEGVVTVATRVPPKSPSQTDDSPAPQSTVSGTDEEKPAKCWNADIGVSGTAQAILGVSGGSAVGVSYGGDLLNSRLFFKFQANGLYGLGLFAGVGVSAEGGAGAVPAGLSSSYGFHMEANRGAAIAWSAGYDYSGPGGVTAGGVHERIPFGRLGVGAGYSVGAGAFTQSTVGLPSAADALNSAIGLLNRSLWDTGVPLQLRQISQPACQ